MKTKLTELRLRIDLINQLVDELWKQPKPSGEIVPNKNLPTPQEMEEMFRTTNGELFVPLEAEHTQNTSELQLCSNSLRLAKARLGKILGLLGESSPYQNDGNRKTVEDIEPASDKAVFEFEGLGHAFKTKQTFVEKIDWLREKIGEIRKDCLELVSEILDRNARGVNDTFVLDIFLQCQTSIIELDNARFYLGFELGHIRDEK